MLNGSRCLFLKYLTITALLSEIVTGIAANAQTATSHRERINQHVVMIEGGGWGGTYNEMVNDIAVALNERDELRVVRVIGEGSVQAVEDLLFLRGIDIALVQSDVLDFYRRQNYYPGIENRLRIIGKLYNEEMHILAPTSIQSLAELEGKRVNFGKPTSGTFMTTDNVFAQLGIRVEVTSYGNEEALRRLKAGDLQALTRITGAPNGLFDDLTPQDGIHFLEVPAGAVTGAYLREELSADEYPNLVPADDSIPTLAVGAVMAVYNFPKDSPRRQRIENFYQTFKANIETLLDTEQFYPKWNQFEFGDAGLPGWTRFR